MRDRYTQTSQEYIESTEGMDMPFCPICKVALAESRMGYAAHIERYHSHVTPELREDVKPVKSSGRSFRQIVSDWETKNDQYLIPRKGPEPEHDADCTCSPCFNRRLDALVASSEEALNDIQSGPLRDTNGD